MDKVKDDVVRAILDAATTGKHSDAAKALDEYATQQSRIDAIGFAEWVDANYWRMDMFHNSNLWYDKKDMFKDTTYTTEQLYELYLLSINKK